LRAKPICTNVMETGTGRNAIPDAIPATDCARKALAYFASTTPTTASRLGVKSSQETISGVEKLVSVKNLEVMVIVIWPMLFVQI
jgi:hypothetical protein